MYLFIDRNKTRENHSWITIRKILNYYGYKNTEKKSKQFADVINALEILIDNEMISLNQSLEDISLDTGIEIIIISENFYQKENWSIVYDDVLDSIMSFKSTVGKDTLLLSFLYVNSFINIRNTQQQKKFPHDYPEAFWGDSRLMAKNLSMSRGTIYKCLNALVNVGVLVKGKFEREEYDGLKNPPTIYVLNKDGHKKEIEWVKQKIKKYQKRKGENRNEANRKNVNKFRSS